MAMPRVKIALDGDAYEELCSRARRLGVPVSQLGRELLLYCLGTPPLPSSSPPFEVLQEKLQAVYELLLSRESEPSTGAVWDLLQTTLEWAIRACVTTDVWVGLQLADPKMYRQFNQRTEETTRRTIRSVLRGADDAQT